MTQDTPEKTGMSVIPIRNEKEIRDFHVDEMSELLWDKPVPRHFPIFLVFHHGKPVGFFLARQQTVIYPALHPEYMGNKEFLKVNKSLITEMKRMTGNPLFMLCDKVKAVGEKTMRAFRLKKAPEQAYIYDEEAK